MLEYAPGSALIVVDLQNDFADPGGSLYVAHGEEVVQACNHEITSARRAGAPIFYTQDWHPLHTPHFEDAGGPWPVHCVADGWGAQFHPALIRDESSPVIRKGEDGGDGYSGFSVRDPDSGETRRTRLDVLLRGLGVERVVVVGLAGDYCVGATARDARELGYEVAMALPAVGFVELQPGDTERALRALGELGVRIEGAPPAAPTQL